MPRAVIIILDGLGDRPVTALHGRTPLEAAHTPNMNLLAGNGAFGRMVAVPDGQQAHTHLGVGLLFGLHPDQAVQLSRGPIEASGIQLDLAPGDVAIRANFATLLPDELGFMVLDRRAGRIDSGTSELAEGLQDLDLGDGVTASFRPTEQHRGVLCLSGPGLDARVSDTDPGNVDMPARLCASRPLADTAGANLAADKLNQFIELAHELLRDHPVNAARLRQGQLPANGVLGRGAGHVQTDLAAVSRQGHGAAVVAGCSTVIGLGRMLGLEIVEDDRFSANVDTNLEAKIAAVLGALDRHELVYLHIKAPDICAHDQQPEAKQRFLERVDGALAPLLQENIVVAICADHGTDSNTGWHIDDPVPVLIGRGGLDRLPQDVNFGEAACSGGDLGLIGSEAFVGRVVTAIRE